MATSLTVSSALLLLLSLVLTDVCRTASTSSCTNTTNSYLWRVRSDPPIYLFGTMHVSYNLLWDDIPQNAKVALQESDKVYLELRLTDEETTNALTLCGNLPKDQTIDQVLSQETYDRIIRYLRRIRDIFPTWIAAEGTSTRALLHLQSSQLFQGFTNEWYRKRPIWILLMLSSLTRENIQRRDIPVLDKFLEKGSQGVGKKVMAIETVQDQCGPLNNLTNSDVEVALRKLLDSLEPQVVSTAGPASTTDRDVTSYQCGDFQQLVNSQLLLPVSHNTSNITLEEREVLLRMNRYLKQRLVVSRNQKVANKIAGWLQQQRNTSYFIALGAGHLIGHKSIVDLLRRKGYTVDHLSVDERVNGSMLPDNFDILGDPDSFPSVRVVSTGEPATNEVTTIATLTPEEIGDVHDKVFNQTNNRTQSSSGGSRQTRSIKLATLPLGSGGVTIATSVIITPSLHAHDSQEIPNTSTRQLCNIYLIFLCLGVMSVWSALLGTTR